MDELTGLRVLRGPDWQSRDTDGGEGYLGTVIELLGNHEVRVLWDMGEESRCRTGQGGKFDLRAFDTAPIGIRHADTSCSQCGQTEVAGSLWQCQLCAPCCRLCSLCYSDDTHDTGHPFLRVDTPNASGKSLPKRKASVKVRTIGLHPGAKVIRGKDWEYGDQDGGQGSEGEVEGYEDAPGAPRSLVRVRWSDGSTLSCRLGAGGKVDVTCVEEEVGPFYYRDHLPLVDTTETSTLTRDCRQRPTPETDIPASQPPTSQPSTSQPPTSQPSTSQPSTSQPSTSQPSTSQPSTSQPSTSQPPTSQPSTSQPPTSQPSTSQPPTSQPSTSQPPTSQPSTSQPPTSQPSTSQPPTSQPSTSQPSTSQPPTSQPSTSQPPTSQQSGIRASTEEEITNCTLSRLQQLSSAGVAEDEELNAGDRVVIRVDEDQLQELQRDCGGCTARMLRCIGITGQVTTISAKGTVSVKFDGSSSKISYRFNPKALLKVLATFKENDVVRIRNDVQLIRLLNRRIGWKSSMDKTANKVGRVVEVDSDGDLRVDFQGVRHIYSPASCLPVPDDGTTPLDTLFPFSPSSSSSASRGGGSLNFRMGNYGRGSDNMSLFRHVRDLVQGEGRSVHGQSTRSLFTAIECGDTDHVRQLCQRDPSAVEREHDGITPLIYASLRGRETCARVLLDLGADVNRCASDNWRKTPLSAVAEGKSEELAELLLSRGANADYLYGHGQTLAHLCVIRDKVIIMRALVSHGADLNIKDDNEQTPLHLAIIMKEDEVMEVLVTAPQVNIHLGNDRDFDMIQLCAFNNNPRALERLLARDCSQVDRLRRSHSTALHIAATNDRVDCVRMLVLQGGANINARQGRSNSTALMLACHRARLDSVEALLELGADVNLSDSNGHTALHLTLGGKVEGKRQGAEVVVALRVQIANLLVSSGAFVDAEDNNSRHPFTYGITPVRSGVQAFMRHNQGVVRFKRRDVQGVLKSLGVSTVDHCGPGELKKALKGIQLPCGVCGASRSDVILQPCAHQCVCRTCSITVARCPLCDEQVKDKVVSAD